MACVTAVAERPIPELMVSADALDFTERPIVEISVTADVLHISAHRPLEFMLCEYDHGYEFIVLDSTPIVVDGVYLIRSY